jgi:hypothetical protein
VQPNLSSAWHTGLSGGAPYSVRCARLAGGELAALRKKQRRTTIINWTIRWCTGLSGEPTVASANSQSRNPRATRGPQQRSVGHTGLSGAPTDPEEQWSDAPEIEGDHAPDNYSACPVHHPTEGKFGLPSWPPTAPSCLWAIKGTARRMEEKTKPSRNNLRLPDSDSTHLILRASELSFI